MTENTLWTIISIISVMVFVVLIGQYRRIRYARIAKEQIFSYVKSYKGRCTGANRFIVTPEVLQNVFLEYDIVLIEHVHQELINDRIIERDPTDQEWCVR